jgi:multimeric flavodoxin WrbA
MDGLTASAKDRVLGGIAKAGVDSGELHLNKCIIKRCLTCDNGWGQCRSEGRCVISDDFATVYEKMVSAGGIVWITPVYWHDFAECLKAFMDRLRRCEAAHNHYLRGKSNLLVACAGGTGRGAIQCLNNLEATLGHMEMIALDRLPVIRFNQSYMLPAVAAASEAFAKEIS